MDIAVFSGNPNNSAEEVITDPTGVGRRIKGMADDHGLVVADVFPIVITDFRPVFDVQAAAPNNPSAEVRSKAREDFRRHRVHPGYGVAGTHHPARLSLRRQ